MASCAEVRPKETSTRKRENHVSIKLEKLQTCNQDAFKLINQGLDLEDRGKTQNAIACYEKGLRTIETGLKSSDDLLGLCPEEASKYKQLLTKLTKAQKEVIMRLETLKNEQQKPTEEGSIVPSVEEISNVPSAEKVSNVPSAEEVSIVPSAPPMPDGVDGMVSGQSDVWQDVKELLNIKEGVSLFHVDENGSVSPWISTTAVLQVFQILKENVEKVPPAFMRCGEWIYPLEPGKSPVLKTQHRTYMFPDVNLQAEEDVNMTSIPSIGVVMSEVVPEALVKRFERILSCYGDFRKDLEKELKKEIAKPSRPPPPAYTKTLAVKPQVPSVVPSEDVIIAEQGIREEELDKTSWSDKVTSGIHVGSQWVSWGLLKGAEYTSVLVAKGANSLRQRLKPNDEPQTVDPEISHNIRQLHQATGAVVQVSSFLVTALGTLTINLGKKLAPHVAQQGGKLIPVKYKPEANDNTQQKIEEAKKVAIAGLQGLSIMFLALEQAGKNLYNSVSVATVQTMQHKYGHEVGGVTEDAMGAAGNAIKTVWNVKQLGPKAIAKRTLKDTGKAMLAMEDEPKNGRTQVDNQ